MPEYKVGVDDCGMPHNLTGCTDELFRMLGRVAVVGAIIERRMSNVVVQWGRDQSDNGRLMDHLGKRFDNLKRQREKSGLDVPPALVAAVSAAVAVMEERNVAIHALRPSDEYAWSNRPDGAKDAPAISAMADLIERMSDVVEALGPYLSTPIAFPEGEFKPCACGCGEMTSATFRRGHRASVIDQRIDRLFDGDVMAFVAWVDEQRALLNG